MIIVCKTLIVIIFQVVLYVCIYKSTIRTKLKMIILNNCLPSNLFQFVMIEQASII